MKIELIYNRFKTINIRKNGSSCSDFLIRYKNTYYTIKCLLSTSSDIDKIYLIMDKSLIHSQQRYNMLLKHRYDNYITAKEFLNIIGGIRDENGKIKKNFKRNRKVRGVEKWNFHKKR